MWLQLQPHLHDEYLVLLWAPFQMHNHQTTQFGMKAINSIIGKTQYESFQSYTT